MEGTMQKLALRTAGTIFFGVGLLHTWRFLAKAVVTIGTFTVPTEWSVVGAVLGFVLSLWMFSAAK